MSNFAKSQMLKYGWTEGKGLGKNESGITEALKPIIKLDNAGIGYESNEYDWLTLLSPKNPAKSKHESQESQREAYEKFENTSTLQDGNLIRLSAISDKKKSTKSTIHVPLLDDQIYKACGSRTVHKTARHGHTLSGKLERLALQDNMFSNVNASDVSQSNSSSVAADTMMIHREMKAECEETEEIEQENDSNGNTSQSETELFVVKSKSTRKKERRRMDNLSRQLRICNIEEGTDKGMELACKSPQQNDKKARIKRKIKKRRKTKEDTGLLESSLEDKATNESLEAPFSLNKSMQCMNILKKVPELVKLDETKLDKLEQEKNRDCNKKKRARSQEQVRNCVITIEELGDMCIKNITKRLCNRDISTWYSLMSNDEKKAQSNQETDPYDKQKDPNKIANVKGHEFLYDKTCGKNSEMQKECKDQPNALSENYSKRGKKKNKDKAPSGQSMLHNFSNKRSSKEKKSKNSTWVEQERIKWFELSNRLNFRIQKKKQQRYLAKHRKQVKNIENVIHKLKDKILSHDVNALIKDLTTIDITEGATVNKRKLTQTHLTPV
ncbi:hypothetical protein DMN91_000782 [Ooceraea biroi]|uniref:G patch domain-containing protein 4 n=1 Tax=Ooceraea biroi TaxID=2015173 RepID=A0A026W0W8_OOCBI|nr:G patch domain-containing protein 4 [Ooceraea biroi]EZA49226.1 G patch domain-containing protein [Ooceraea biroi]RLU26983.1 hypothetical protein DMN91_000782 [Ooceraea biroi]